MLEQSIQTSIREKLIASGWMVIKLMHTSANGIPDLLCLKDGEAVFIEVKQTKGRVSKLQEHRINQLGKYGFDAFVARSVNDIKTMITTTPG